MDAESSSASMEVFEGACGGWFAIDANKKRVGTIGSHPLFLQSNPGIRSAALPKQQSDGPARRRSTDRRCRC